MAVEPSGPVRPDAIAAATPRPTSWDSLLDDAKVVVAPWIVARLLVALAFALAWAVANHWVPGASISPGLAGWDGSYYEAIARVGYSGLPSEALRFFPLYPA